MRTPRARDAGLDFARTAAMLSVIMIHVTSGYVYRPSNYMVLERNLAFLFNQLSRFSVPLFLLLSGLSLCGNQSRSDGGAVRFYFRRFWKLLPPYWFWTTFYFLFGRNFDLATLQEPLYTRSLLIGCAGPHLYFVVILAQCYLIFPLLRRWTVRHPYTCLLIWSLCLYAATELIRFRRLGLSLLPRTFWPYLGLSLLLWGAPFVLGMVLAEHGYEALKAFTAARPALFPVLWLLAGFLCALESRATGSVDTDRLSLFLYAALSFPALLSVWAVVGRWTPVRRVSSFLARRSMTVYYCHVVILTLCRRRWAFNGMRGFLRLYGVVVVLSTAAAALLDLDLAAPFRHGRSAGDPGEADSAP